VTLPTAPPVAATSGRLAIDLGASVPTDVWAAPSGGDSGIAVPSVQPDGGLSLVLANFVALRGFFGVGVGEGRRQITGRIVAPTDAAWTGGLGASFRFLFAEDLVFVDLAPSLGFAVLPSAFRITRHPYCEYPDACAPDSTYETAYWEVMPFFATSARLGVRPLEWLALHAGLTVRNQPNNEAAFGTGDDPGSSVSAGPIGLVLHIGTQIDFIDALGLRAELQWPVVGSGLDYGPIVSIALQGRVGGSRAAPFGARF
jgi:hypothetical protein